MKTVVLSLLLLVLAMPMSNAMCPNITGKSIVPMPSLDPVQFSYKVQINIPDQSKSLDGYEFYDHENGTIYLSVDQTVDSMQSHKEMTFDYQYNQTFIVDEGTDNCTVLSLDPALPHRATLFGVGVENGPQAVKHAFYWNGTYNTTNQGVEIIDGIRTDHYQTCLTFEDGNLTYLVDVYFSQPNWTMPSAQNAPVLLTLNATDNMNNSWYYIFKFSDYHSSMSEREWRPHKPRGMICEGRKDVPSNQTFPQNLQFELQVWTFYNGRHIATYMKEYYDYTRKYFRFDQTKPNGMQVSTIHDFNQGLQYVIDSETGMCNIAPIPVNGVIPDAAPSTADPSLVQLRRPSELFALMNYTFGGYGERQGIPAQIWIATVPVEMPDPRDPNITNYLYETHYYSYNNKRNGQLILLGIDIESLTRVNATYNVTTHSTANAFNFKYSVELSVFDTSVCYNSSMRQTILLKFDIDDKASVASNSSGFNDAFLMTAAQLANVSQLRVSSSGLHAIDNSSSLEQTATADDNGAGIYVWLTLVGISDVKGDSAEMIPESNLTAALANLQKAVSDNKFVVEFYALEQQVQTVAFPDYLKTEEEVVLGPNPVPPRPQPSPTPAKSSGVSTGAVVGIAIAMVIVGLIAGYAFSVWRAKRAGAQYAYTMQD